MSKALAKSSAAAPAQLLSLPRPQSPLPHLHRLYCSDARGRAGFCHSRDACCDPPAVYSGMFSIWHQFLLLAVLLCFPMLPLKRR